MAASQIKIREVSKGKTCPECPSKDRQMDKIELTPDSLALFSAYIEDAGNWSGTPCVGGNVEQGLNHNGNLSDLKKKGLLKTFRYEGNMWIEFTPKGIEFAKSIGLDIRGVEA